MNKPNKPNMNMFNTGNPMDQQEMLKQMRTPTLIKHIVALLTGFIPMLIVIFLIGVDTTDIEFGQWQNITHPWEVSYGLMWAIGFATIFFSVAITLLLIKFNKDVKVDVIPMVTTWSVVMFSLFIIPMKHSLLWIEVFLILIFALIGFIGGFIGVMFYSIVKFTKEMQKMQGEGGQNPFDIQQGPGQNNSFNFNNQKKPSEKKETKKEETTNPFVDIEEDDD